MKKYLVGILVGLLVVVVSLTIFVYLLLQNNTFIKQEDTKQENVLGSDRDKHGCIGSAGYTWSEEENKCVRPWEEKSEQVTAVQDKDNKNIAKKKYVVAEKSEYIPSGGREHKFFAIYDLEGKLINKVSLPNDAMPNHITSSSTFGDKIYYLSGSSKTTSIGELDPVTGESHIFEFTKSESTNVGNVLSAIVGWTVSDDNKMLAWLDTECIVHIANINGTDFKRYSTADEKCISASISFSKNMKSLYVWDGRSLFLRELNIASGAFSNIVKNENQSFLISPSNRYIIYSNLDTPLAIRDLVANKNIDVVTPEKYDFYDGQNYSADEKTVYFRASVFQGKSDDYVVQTDGNNLRKITDKDENQKMGAFLSSPGYEEEYLVGEINSAEF